jgi:hypothetical protein
VIDDPTKALPPDSRAAFSLERGRSRRADVPRRLHGDWKPAHDRPDVAQTLDASNEGRLPDLVPIRIGRMLASPFAFLRGSAAVMANDLADTPHIDSRVQLCGDAHLANFGVFASPERRLVFDVNDFDETYRGPWEWDLKRLAASVVVAARENGFSESTNRDMARLTSWRYRRWMRRFAGMRALQVWYAAIPIESIIERVEAARALPGGGTTIEISLDEARRKDHMAAFGKLSIAAPGGGWLIRDRPPLLQRLADDDPDRDGLAHLRAGYLRSLAPDRRLLVEKHRLLDVALKVVGVGSVGTRAWIALFLGVDGTDPLFLQLKEAQPSVLERFVGKSEYSNSGQRVVAGQRVMQATSDIFLGWQHVPEGLDGKPRDFYVRQLKDWKGSFPFEALVPAGASAYGRACAWTLARAHARSGDRFALAAYLGKSVSFDHAIATFAEAYADQNERDYQALAEAVKEGRVPAETGL